MATGETGKNASVLQGLADSWASRAGAPEPPGGPFDTGSNISEPFSWRATNGGTITAKATDDQSDGVFNLLHNSPVGYLFHMVMGPGTVNGASAAIGIGVDNNGTGILISNKLNGRGFYGVNNNTITAADGYLMQLAQSSTVAPLFRLESNVAGAADLAQFVVSGSITPSATQKIAYFGNHQGAVGAVFALDGRLEWNKKIIAKDVAAGSAGLGVYDNDGIVAAQKQHLDIGKSGIAISNFSGSDNLWYPTWIGGVKYGAHGGIRSGPAANTTSVPITEATGWEVMGWDAGSTAKVGFLGATPVVRQTAAAAATDAATTQTLANSLRTALINLGLAA